MYLGVVSGGSPSECVFSGASLTVTKLRNSLGESTVEMSTVSKNMVERKDYEEKQLMRYVEKNFDDYDDENDDENLGESTAVGHKSLLDYFKPH